MLSGIGGILFFSFLEGEKMRRATESETDCEARYSEDGGYLDDHARSCRVGSREEHHLVGRDVLCLELACLVSIFGARLHVSPLKHPPGWLGSSREAIYMTTQ